MVSLFGNQVPDLSLVECADFQGNVYSLVQYNLGILKI